jgi:hypothetical protein
MDGRAVAGVESVLVTRTAVINCGAQIGGSAPEAARVQVRPGADRGSKVVDVVVQGVESRLRGDDRNAD